MGGFSPALSHGVFTGRGTPGAGCAIFARMRHAIPFLLAMEAAASGVRWREPATLDEALGEARRGGHLVLIDVFATWCGPCHQMDREVYARDDVAAALDADFVTVRVDGEQGLGAEVAARYRVTGYPTLLVLDAEGQEIDRVLGTATPEELLKTLANWRAGRGTLADLETKLAKIPGDLALVLEIGQRCAYRGDARGAEKHLLRLVREDAKNAQGLAAKALATLGKYLYVRGTKDYRKGIATLEQLIKRFPNAPEAKDTAESLARAWHRLGRDDRARALLDAYVAAGPTESKRHNLYAWFSYKQNFDRLRGLEVAAQGLSVNPQDDGLWDTMAELYFAIGQRANAIGCERMARSINPKDEYYPRQIARFESASGVAPLPGR